MQIGLATLYGRSLIDPSKGDDLGAKLVEAIRRGERVQLDFEGIDLVLSAFLNPAFGELYAEFSSAQINEIIEIVNESDSHRAILGYVIENAKAHARGDQYEKSSEEALRKMLEN